MSVLLAGALVAALLAPPGAPELRAQSEAAFRRLNEIYPTARATWRPAVATPALVTGLQVPVAGADLRAQAEQFLAAHRDLVALPALRFVEATTARDRAQVRFEQVVERAGESLPVVDRAVVVSVRDGVVTTLASDAVPLAEVKPATIDAEQAKRLAVSYVVTRMTGGTPLPAAGTHTARKVVFANADQGVEGYEVDLVHTPFAVHLVVRVDGHAAEVIGARNRVVQ